MKNEYYEDEILEGLHLPETCEFVPIGFHTLNWTDDQIDNWIATKHGESDDGDNHPQEIGPSKTIVVNVS